MKKFLNYTFLTVISYLIVLQTYAQTYDCDAVKLCPNNACCSKYHYCGTDEPWCGAGCLSGNCLSTVAASSTTTTLSTAYITSAAITTAKATSLSTASCFNLTLLQCILSSSSSTQLSTASTTSATTTKATSLSTASCFNLTLLQCILSSSSSTQLSTASTILVSTTSSSNTTGASLNLTTTSPSSYMCVYETCSSSQCCSVWGYCGIGDAWCGSGCQGGPCYSNQSLTTTTPTTPTTTYTTTVYTGPPTTPPPCLITFAEFTDAVLASGTVLTKFGYNAPPPPSQEQYNNLCLGAQPKGNISTKQQLAMFLAQICWESIGLKEKRELICIASGCVGTYGSGAPGVGYYGRGYMQLSWPSNYAAASQALFGDNRLWQNPDLVASNDQYAWDTAFWYWKAFVGNTKNFGSTTMAINGGLECNGPYRDRARGRYDIYVLMMKIFSIPEAPVESGCYN